jgi:MoxR-like ATPase
MFDSIDSTAGTLADHGYVADAGLCTSLFLALKMGKPLFLEGEPGVGKTEVAKVLSQALETRLIRLQCYEGLDLSQAVYEWNYPRQLLTLQRRQGEGLSEQDLFTEDFLLKRPLLQAIDAAQETAPVLLIDELDRADEEFESFLLELLSDFQVTIPEIGTLRARHRPVVILTSNRTREIHDALKRRCVYHWIDYPEAEKELQILRHKVPELEPALARQIVNLVQTLRREDLFKAPGVAETLDWSRALGHLATKQLDPEVIERTLGFLLKYQDDIDQVRSGGTGSLLERSQDEGGTV